MNTRVLASLILFAPTVTFAGPKAGDFLTSGPTTAKRIALSFDDGPGPQTDRYLELLSKYGVKGTFFMLAEQAKLRPQMAKAVAEKGHEVASHTYNHVNYAAFHKSAAAKNPSAPEKAVEEARTALIEDLKKSRRIIEETTGSKIDLLRMPHGIDRPWIKDAARKTGFVLVNWTHGADWVAQTEEKAISGYVKAIKSGAIFLMHDGGTRRERSLAITEAVIKAAKEQGYEIVTVGELIGTSAQP